MELHRSKRSVGKKNKLRGNLGNLGKEAAKEYVKDLVEEFIDHFSSSSEEQFTGKEQQVTEEQSRDFVDKMLNRGVLEEVWDRDFVKEIWRKVSVASNPFRVLNKLSEALNNLFETSEQQVTEVPQTTEGQQVATEMQQVTEVPQVTEKQQNTKKQQVMNEDGDTALHLATIKDDLNTVKYLVEKGADVDVKNKYGATPLHAASIRGNLEIAQFLIDHGANVNV
ncbi:ankyrin repeat domain-containing protein [Wolbachia endosymbiont of Kerria lacca]|uniref:ankyrin repeat domain-containing protein n=1 Tax=Wolbachia endosymbiont of Kerria lacca TaxID=427705 RepID=UPI003F681DFC